MSNIRSWLDKKPLEEREHFLGEYPRLCLEGGQIKKIFRLLSDFDFIEAKINNHSFRVHSLIKDYDLIDDKGLLANPEYNTQAVKSLKLIQEALRLSAYILIKDTKQLAGQLSGRLLCFNTPEIQGLLQQISQNKTLCLRTLTPSLTAPGGRLLRTLSGHQDWVKAVAVTPNGKYVISGSIDNTLKVWDLQLGEEKLTFSGHRDWVKAVAVTPNGKYVISGSNDNTLKVWDLQLGEEKLTFSGHCASINAVTVTSNNKYVISCSDDTILKTWDLQSGEEKFTIWSCCRGWVSAVAVTSDNKYIISGSRDPDPMFGIWRTLKVWDFQSGSELFSLRGHSDSVNTVAVTSDSKYVVSGSRDGTLKVWDLKSREEKFTLRGHRFSVDTVAITSDSKHIISGCRGGVLKVWDLFCGEELLTLKAHQRWVSAIAVTLDGSVISGSRDGTLKVWDLKSREEKITLSSHINGHADSVNAVAVTSDGKYVISGSRGGILKVWDLKSTEKKPFSLIGHRDAVNAVTVTSNGKYVISGSDDETVKAWDLQSGAQKLVFWGHKNSVTAVAVTSDSKYIISASRDNTLKIWDFDKELRVKDLEPKKPVNTIATLIGHRYWINAITITSDDKYVISASEDETLKVWNLQSRKELFTLSSHRHWANTVAVTSNGKYIISASRDNTLKIWDLKSKKEIASFTGESEIKCCAVAPDGVTILAGEVSGRLHFLRLEGNEHQQKAILQQLDQLSDREFLQLNQSVTEYLRDAPVAPPPQVEQQLVQEKINLASTQIKSLWEQQATQMELLGSLQAEPFAILSDRYPTVMAQLKQTQGLIDSLTASKDQNVLQLQQWAKQGEVYQAWQSNPMTVEVKHLAQVLKLPKQQERIASIRK